MNTAAFTRFLKQNAFIVTTILVLSASLPVTLWRIGNIRTFRAEASNISFTPYPGLLWTNPKSYKTAFLSNEGKPDEQLLFANGYMVTASIVENLSVPLSSYYDTLLHEKGFRKLQETGNPQTETNWTITYQKDESICQLQYYKTPYDNTHYTFLLFFGNV
jgi:hypothetical protein